MAMDGWDELSATTIRLGWLERELAVSGANRIDHTALIEEIREVSARRDALVAALCETAGEGVMKQPRRPAHEPLVIGF